MLSSWKFESQALNRKEKSPRFSSHQYDFFVIIKIFSNLNLFFTIQSILYESRQNQEKYEPHPVKF
jgi:hypothetical protein